MTTRLDRTIRRAGARLKTKTQFGILGNSDGVIRVPDKPGWYFFRPLISTGRYGVAVELPPNEGANFPVQLNMPVEIGVDNTGQTVILGISRIASTSVGLPPSITNPGDPQNTIIFLEQLTPLRGRPSQRVGEELFAEVLPGKVQFEHTYVDFAGGSISFESVWATEGNHLYGIVAIKPDGTLEVAASTEQATSVALDSTDIQGAIEALTYGSMPIKAFKITFGDTALKGNISDGAIDLRYLFSPTNYANNITMAHINSSTFSTVQHMQDVFHSAGWVSYEGGTTDGISDGGGATIDVESGTGLIRIPGTNTSQIQYFDWAAVSGTAIPTDTVRYIGVEYNAGSPQVVVRTTKDWNYLTDFPLGTVVNEDDVIHIKNAPHEVGDHASLMIQFNAGTMPFAYDVVVGGLALSDSAGANRYLSLTAGRLWDGITPFDIPAQDTDPGGAADTMQTYYRTTSPAGEFDFVLTTGVTEWDNDQYDNGSGTLQSMTNNRYANIWVFTDTEDGQIVIVYPQAQFVTEAAARDESLPSQLPARVTTHCKLVARLIFQKTVSGEDDPVDIVSELIMAGGTGSSVTDHNSQGGLQGGTSGEYYHLTAAQHTELTGWTDDSQTANQVLASPDGAPGQLSVRALVGDDIPNLDASKITSGQLLLEQGGTETNLSGSGPGVLQQRTSGAAVTNLQYNFTATAAPTAGDDSGDGYEVGSMWLDVTNNKAYICLDNTLAAAVWVDITGGGGGSNTNDSLIWLSI
jgi:hypothetical protein